MGKTDEYLAWDLGLIERLCKSGHAGVIHMLMNGGGGGGNSNQI